MAPLPSFPLPLPKRLPPGYDYEEHDMSDVSETTAFKAGVDQRDTFLGRRCCIVCGVWGEAVLGRCYIIKDSEEHVVGGTGI